ncbi:uncharacterized protein LOC125654362 [Ostrea edulis]|uniref:uncharacterized protein LOC125654362 n=1 Tax=Ostrea edulis TaxID=37623 RepID=UPI0024AED79B|nr:uncharacterized protein LOC125654362 [Ostrea edulis]
MDFSALIAELRNIASSYNGRDIDSNVSTAMYCEMFRKILQKAESEVVAYDDQIVILWMTLSQLCQTYKTLTKCKERNDLYQHIFLLCAKVVLNIKWQQLSDEDQSKQNFRKTVEATHGQLVHAGFDRFGLLLNIMENPWTDPTITKIMSGDPEDESNSDTEEDENEMSDERKKEVEERKKKRMEERDEEFTKYITTADPLILRLRVEMLMQENCEEWALNLCNCCLKHRRYQRDLEFKTMQLLLLFKLGNMDKLQEICETIECHHGIYIIEQLEKKDSNQSLCVRLIQIFLVQDWIRPDRNCCTKKLLQMWIKYQSVEDQDRDKFLDSVWAIAKISSSTDQVNQLVTGLVKKCGLNLLQLYTDLCVYAINFDKGCCEQQMIQGNMEGVKKQQWAISVTCIKLADLYCNCSPKLARIAALTAFSLNPTIQNFNVVRKTFTDKRKEKMQALKQDSVDNKGKEIPQKEYKPRQSKYLQKVNPATIHEVERLLNMLRPYYLDPEMGFERLQPVCQKFMDERGGGIVESSKKPSRPPAKTNANPSRQNSDIQYYCDDSTALSRPATAVMKTNVKNPPTTAQPTYPSAASSSSTKAPLFGNKPRSYRAMSQPESFPKPNKSVRANANITQRLVPMFQPPSFTVKTTTIDSTSNISELLKATKTLPQYNPDSSPSVSHSYTSSAQISQNTENAHSQLQTPDVLRRQGVTLPINTGGNNILSRSEVIGNAGDKSIYHHLYQPVKIQEPPSLKAAKPPSNKLQVTQLPSNKFLSHSSNYNFGGQIDIQNNALNSVSRPADAGDFTETESVGDTRRPSAEELQSIVDWLQLGTEDAVTKQSNTFFNPAIPQTPPPAHTSQPSLQIKGQGGLQKSQLHSTLPAGQKVDLNTLLSKPKAVSNVLKIQPKGKTAVQEAASQISQRLSDLRSQTDTGSGDVQLLLKLQRTCSSVQRTMHQPSASSTVSPTQGILEKDAQKNLTDKDLSLEEMKRRIAEIVQKQKLLCAAQPNQPAKRRRSSSPKGKKQKVALSSNPSKNTTQTASPAATVTHDSCNSPSQPQADNVQKQQIQGWFNNRRQIQQQIEKHKQQPQNSHCSKPQLILQQQVAPIQYVSAAQIENLTSSHEKTMTKPNQKPTLHGSTGFPQKKSDQYDHMLGLLSKSPHIYPTKPLLEQKLLQDDSVVMASTSDCENPSNAVQKPKQLQTLQRNSQEARPQSPLCDWHIGTGGTSKEAVNSEKLSSNGSTPTTLLSVLLEKSKYINSVARTLANSNSSSGDVQTDMNIQPPSLVSAPSSCPSVLATSANTLINSSSQQILSVLLPKTAHCIKQVDNSSSALTSSTLEEKPTDRSSCNVLASTNQPAAAFQLRYVGQIKTKEFPSTSNSENDLFKEDTSGLRIQTSAAGLKRVTCIDNDVVKEISKMMENEKSRHANVHQEIPIQSKPQQQLEDMSTISRIPTKNESQNSSNLEKEHDVNSKSLETDSCTEQPCLEQDTKSNGEQSEVVVKNYRQTLIDSIENGIKQSMEQIDVSAELIEKSPEKHNPSPEMNLGKVTKSLETIGTSHDCKIQETAFQDHQDILKASNAKSVESTEFQIPEDLIMKTPDAKETNLECFSPQGDKLDSSATVEESWPSTESSQGHFVEEVDAEALVKERQCSIPSVTKEAVDQMSENLHCVSSKVIEADQKMSSSKAEDEEGKMEGGNETIEAQVQTSGKTSGETVINTSDSVNQKSMQIEPTGASKDPDPTTGASKDPDPTTGASKDPDPRKVDNTSVEMYFKDKETEEINETSELRDNLSETQKDKTSGQTFKDDQIPANMDQKSFKEGSVLVDKDQIMEEEPSKGQSVDIVRNDKLSEPDTDGIGSDDAETGDSSLNKLEQTDSLCMEDIKLDNIDRSKVIHKLKSDMNNLLHQIKDINEGHVSEDVNETSSESDINPCQSVSVDGNAEALKSPKVLQNVEEDMEKDISCYQNTDSNVHHSVEPSEEKESETDSVAEINLPAETDLEKRISKVKESTMGEKHNGTHESENQTTDLAGDVKSSNSKHAENMSTCQKDSTDIVWFSNEECKDDNDGKCSAKNTDERREHVNTIEEGNRKLDKLRKNQKNKNSAIPANFGFDFCDEINTDQSKLEEKTPSEDEIITDQSKLEEKTPSEDVSSKLSAHVKLSVQEPKHKRLQGSAILQTKRKYRENLQGAQEKAEKIKEHIISGTKVVEITEKALSDSKAASSEIKKNTSGSSRINDPEFDQQSVSSTSSSCSSNSSINLKSSQANAEKEKGATNVPSKSKKCLICGKIFMSVFSLKEHVKNKCKSSDLVKSMDYEFSSRFTCTKCGMTSSSAFDMKKHLKKLHNMMDDRDFKDLLISSYKCEMCGDMFKDKTAIYSHVSTSCSYLSSSRKRDVRTLTDDKYTMQSVLNTVNPNHGKQTELVVSTSNQILQDKFNSQERMPTSRAELQIHPKTVEIKTVEAKEKTKQNSENSKKTLQETVINPNVASSDHSLRLDTDSKKKTTEPKIEVVMTESKSKVEPQVLNQRITRSKLENSSTSTTIGRIQTKFSKPQSLLERSGKNSNRNQENLVESEKTGREDVSRKLNFESNLVKTSGNDETGVALTTERDSSTELGNTRKDIDDEHLKSPAVRRQSRTRKVNLSNGSPAPKNDKKDVLTNLPNQSKSLPSKTSTCVRHTRSKGTVSDVALKNLDKMDMNLRKGRTSHQSGSADVSLLSDCSEDQQKSLGQSKKKKSEERTILDDTEPSSETKDNGQKRKKDPPSKQPSAEVPARGKRLIKVKKYDQYEVPDFLKSQVNSSNMKRQFRSQRISGRVLGNPSSSSKRVIKKESIVPTRKCSNCGKKFASQAKLIKHIASVHLSPCKSQTNPQFEKCCYQCRYCKATYKTYVQFLNHVPGHATQILEGMENKQLVPAVVHVPSKSAYVKDTDDTLPTALGNECNNKKEKMAVKDGSFEHTTRATRQSESKLKQVKEDNQTHISTRSKRSTTPAYDGQNDRISKKYKGSLNSKFEEDKKVNLNTACPSSEREKEEKQNSVTEEHVTKTRSSISSVTEDHVTKTRSSISSVTEEHVTKTRSSISSVTEEHVTKTRSSISSVTEEHVTKTRSSIRSARGTSKNKEEKSDGELNSSTRQLRSKRESGGNEEIEENKLSKRKPDTNTTRNTRLHVSLERLSPKVSEHVTRSNSKRKSESSESSVSTKKPKADLSDSTECETSEFEFAESDAEISFRRRLSRKRKAPENSEKTYDSDMEEIDNDEEYSLPDYGNTSDDSLAEVEKSTEKNKTNCVEVQNTHNSNVSDSEKSSQEKVRVTVVEDDEFAYVKSPTHENTSNEAFKVSSMVACDQKEKVFLSRSSKNNTAYLSSFMSYIDNQSKNSNKDIDKNERIRERNSSQGNKKTERNTGMLKNDDKTSDILSTSEEIKVVSSATSQSKGPSFLDSFLEHCNKASDGPMIRGAGSDKKNTGTAESMSGEQSNDGTSKTKQKRTQSENDTAVQVREKTEPERDGTVPNSDDRKSVNAFQDTFKSFVSAAFTDISTEGNTVPQKESLSDVIEGLSDNTDRKCRAGSAVSEDSVQTVSSRCTDVSDTSESAQKGPNYHSGSKSKRMRHIYHNGKIWHVGAGNVTSMSVKLDLPGDPESVSNSACTQTPGPTLKSNQLIKVDRDKNSPHRDSSNNTYTYTTAEELKRETQSSSNKWKVKREKNQLSFRK